MSCNCNQNPQHNHPCKQVDVAHHVCNQCAPTPCVGCPIKDLSTDCVLYDKSDIKCENTTVVSKNTSLSIALVNIVNYFCTKLSEIQKNFTLKNIGLGAKIFKQTNLLGEKELRTLVSTNGNLTIVENDETIDLSINYSATNPCFISPNNSIQINYDNGTKCIGLTTCVVSTDNTLTVNQTNGCFDVELNNLQKTISTFPYTLTLVDDKQTIFVENGASNVVINVPNGLPANFTASFIQEGTGEVVIQGAGTAVVMKPATLQNKIKSQYSWAMIEKKLATDNYYLIGKLMPL